MLYANNDRVASHQRRYTRRRPLRALAGAGFETVRATYYNTLLVPANVPAVLLGNFVAGVVMGGYLEVRASS